MTTDETDRITRILSNPDENNAAKIARLHEGCPRCGNRFYINDEGKIAGDLLPMARSNRDYPGADALCQKCGIGLRLTASGGVEQLKRVTL